MNTCVLVLCLGLLLCGDVLGASAPGASKKPIWMIAVGNGWAAHEYLLETGHLVGFNLDVIRAVCAAGNMDCRIVRDVYSNCIDSTAGQHMQGGKGLMGGWYDACTGWAASVGRIQIFDFSLPFLQNFDSYFFKKKGGAFDPTDIRGKSIGFMDGWVTDEKCMARQNNIQGSVLPASAIKHYTQVPDMVRDIVADKIAAGFISPTVMGEFVKNGLVEQVTGNGIYCMLAGPGMVARKDSNFTRVWDQAFQNLKSSGSFRKICEDGVKNHKFEVSRCVN